MARQVRRAKATGHPRRVNPVPQPAPDAGIATHSADASAERATLQGKAVGRATPSQAYVVRRREGEPGPKRVNRPNRPPPTRPGCEIWMQVKAGKASE